VPSWTRVHIARDCYPLIAEDLVFFAFQRHRRPSGCAGPTPRRSVGSAQKAQIRRGDHSHAVNPDESQVALKNIVVYHIPRNASIPRSIANSHHQRALCAPCVFKHFLFLKWDSGAARKIAGAGWFALTDRGVRACRFESSTSSRGLAYWRGLRKFAAL
jgi:hypothetical protein